MGLIQTSRQSTGGGGGGLTITGWSTETFTQDTNFVSGGVTLSLAHTPIVPGSVQLAYNGQTIYEGFTWSISGGTITIEFSDPYVEDGDTPGYFQVIYPY